MIIAWVCCGAWCFGWCCCNACCAVICRTQRTEDVLRRVFGDRRVEKMKEMEAKLERETAKKARKKISGQ
jgi:hypothetical protein